MFFLKTPTEVIRKSADLFHLFFSTQVEMAQFAGKGANLPHTTQELLDEYQILLQGKNALFQDWAIQCFNNLFYKKMEEIKQLYATKMDECIANPEIPDRDCKCFRYPSVLPHPYRCYKGSPESTFFHEI